MHELRAPIRLAVCAGLLLAGCIGGGDQAFTVAIRNVLDEPVVLYQMGRERPQFKVPLAPGEIRSANYLYTGGNLANYTVRVEAESTGGKLLFCKVYTFEELDARGRQIDIRSANECSSTGR